MASRKKIKSSCYLERRQFARLRRMSETSRVPLAAIMRDAIDRAIDHWESTGETPWESDARRLQEKAS